MKVKTISDVRKEVEAEVKEKYYRDQYRWMTNLIETCTEHTVVCSIAVMEMRGRSPEYIRTFFKDLCLMFDMPAINGKVIKAEDVKKDYEKRYGLDFDLVRPHFESEEEFLKKYL